MANLRTKVRTRKSAAKRFKISKTGKLLHRAHGTAHLKSNKSKRRLRRLKKPVNVEGVMKKKITRMLGI